MVTKLLHGVRQTQSTTAFVSNRRRYVLIEELIARSWTTFVDFEPIVKEAFAPGPTPVVSDWVGALDVAAEGLAARTFYLFFQAITKLQHPHLEAWREPLSQRIDSLEADDLERLRTLDASFVGQYRIRGSLAPSSLAHCFSAAVGVPAVDGERPLDGAVRGGRDDDGDVEDENVVSVSDHSVLYHTGGSSGGLSKNGYHSLPQIDL